MHQRLIFLCAASIGLAACQLVGGFEDHELGGAGGVDGGAVGGSSVGGSDSGGSDSSGGGIDAGGASSSGGMGVTVGGQGGAGGGEGGAMSTSGGGGSMDATCGEFCKATRACSPPDCLRECLFEQDSANASNCGAEFDDLLLCATRAAVPCQEEACEAELQAYYLCF